MHFAGHRSTGNAIATALYEYCVYSDSSIVFAGDTTILGLNTGGDESAHRGEIQKLSTWCSENNLHLNIRKTKEMAIDFQKKGEKPAPLHIEGGLCGKGFLFQIPVSPS